MVHLDTVERQEGVDTLALHRSSSRAQADERGVSRKTAPKTSKLNGEKTNGAWYAAPNYDGSSSSGLSARTSMG